MKSLISSILIFLCLSLECFAFEETDSIAVDSASVKKRSLMRKIFDYFEESNKVRDYKHFDMSIIGGPHYSSDTKFGIGLVAAGLYRHDKTDSITQPSNLSIYLDATTSMFFKFGIRGTHFSTGDRRRINYDVNVSSVKTKFWGIGYDRNINDDNESDYKYFSCLAEINFLWRMAGQLFVGPDVTFNYINGRKFEKPELWEGQSNRIVSTGIGFTVQYDSRDNVTSAYRGIFVRLDQLFSPRLPGNKYTFSMTRLSLSSYSPLWKDCILAGKLNSRLTYGDTPWGLMSTLGGSDNMRGYFEGRYRDKCEIDLCVELRQHVWRRHGVVAWIGAGSVFRRIQDIRWRTILPNYGIGYRWEFKQRVNVRLDLGFGRHQTGFIFNINEAF